MSYRQSVMKRPFSLRRNEPRYITAARNGDISPMKSVLATHQNESHHNIASRIPHRQWGLARRDTAENKDALDIGYIGENWENYTSENLGNSVPAVPQYSELIS